MAKILWIEITKSYYGDLGTYPKGIKQDMTDNPNTAKKLIKKGFAKECVNPYDAKANLPLRKFNQLKQVCEQTKQELAANQAALKKAKDVADTMPRYERIIESLSERLKKEQKAVENFAAEKKIPLEKKNNADDAGQNGQADGTDTGTGEGSKPEDDDNAAGQAAQAGQSEQ